MRTGVALFEHVRAAAARLAGSGIPDEEARLDAELIARHALGGWDRGRLLVHGREAAPVGFEDAFETLVARRAAREPVAYLLGRAEFWGLEFEVTRDVLIPRPETELLVEAAVQIGAAMAGPATVVDVGTGSGCVAIALAHELPRARIVATDSSPAAIAVARRNATRHRVDTRVTFAVCDLLGDLQGVDLVASNPPYVTSGELLALQSEVRVFEPAGALVGGEDGLDVIRALVREAARRLGPGAWLLFEFGHGQDAAVREILNGAQDARGRPAWSAVELRPDLRGIPRAAVARRR